MNSELVFTFTIRVMFNIDDICKIDVSEEFVGPYGNEILRNR